jgi:hypothetical protein
MKRWMMRACLVAVAATARAQDGFPPCQILDRVEEPAWQVHAGLVGSADVEAPDGSSFRQQQLRGGGGLYYWRTGLGDIELAGAYDLTFYDGSGGVDLPDRTAALRLDAGYVWRQWDGSAVKLNLYPGLYSDLRDPGFEDLALPLQVLGIQAFNPQLSGVLGVALYPGFDRSFDPRFGIRWALSDQLSLDLMYPESRLLFRPRDNWDVFAGLRNEAVAQYQLEEDDPRDSFRYEETRVYVGVNAPVSGVLRAMVRAGWVMNRAVDFGRTQPARDVEDTYFVQAGVGGTL